MRRHAESGEANVGRRPGVSSVCIGRTAAFGGLQETKLRGGTGEQRESGISAGRRPEACSVHAEWTADR